MMGGGDAPFFLEESFHPAANFGCNTLKEYDFLFLFWYKKGDKRFSSSKVSGVLFHNMMKLNMSTTSCSPLLKVKHQPRLGTDGKAGLNNNFESTWE